MIKRLEKILDKKYEIMAQLKLASTVMCIFDRKDSLCDYIQVMRIMIMLINRLIVGRK